jgi:hypothetical protein
MSSTGTSPPYLVIIVWLVFVADLNLCTWVIPGSINVARIVEARMQP